MGSNTWSPWRYLRQHHPDIEIVEYELHDLDDKLLGCTDHYTNTIYLDSHLTCHERRATVGHECGHLKLDACVNGIWVPAPEWKVDRWAARRLIPVEALGRAMLWSQHIPEIAEELFVDEKTVRDRMRYLTDAEQDTLMALGDRMRVA